MNTLLSQSSTKKQRSFSPEFKENPVKLVLEGGQTIQKNKHPFGHRHIHTRQMGSP